MAGKTQLIDRIVARGSSRAAATAAVEAVLAEVTALLADGERVTLTGFGSFDPVERAARTARNPRTGATVDVPAARVVRFHPGAGLRSALGGGPVPDAPSLPGAVAAAPARESNVTRGRGKKPTAPVAETAGAVGGVEPAAAATSTRSSTKKLDEKKLDKKKLDKKKLDTKADEKPGKKPDTKSGKTSDKKSGTTSAKTSDKKSGKTSGKKSGKKHKK